MRRSRLLAGMATLAVAAGAPVLQGCSADKAAGVDAAKAASATAAAKTARFHGVVDATGFGLPDALHLTFDGVTSLTSPDLDLTTDAAPIAQRAMPLVSALPIELRIRDGVAFLKVPELARTMVPGNKAWASLDARRLMRALGKDPALLDALTRVDSASLLRAMRAAGTLKPAGTQEIDGVTTTHLRGTLRLADQIRLLPAAARTAVRRVIARARARARAAGVPSHAKLATPVDVWVDDAGLVRRERAVLTVPKHARMPGGRATIQIDLQDFGAALAGDTPKVADTFDATGMIARFARVHRSR